MITLSPNSMVYANHLTIQRDGEEFTIGDPQQSIYIRIPLEGVRALEFMNGKNSIAHISILLQEKYNLEVDVFDFVQTLLELNLIHRIDDEVLILLEEKYNDEAIRGKFGRLLFNKFTCFFYIMAFISSLLTIILNPRLVPSYHDYFIFDKSIGLSLLIFFLISWLLTILHESAHYFAAAALGVPVNFRISIRWFWMVIEANMNSLWSVERKKRYLPFLAGMAWDSVVLLIALIFQFCYINNAAIVGYMKLITLIQIYKFLWHLLIFFRTDLYYVLITVTNSSNLLAQAVLYLKKPYFKKASLEWENLSQPEQKMSKMFSVIYILGILAAILLFSFYSIPGFWSATSKAMNNLINNSWDSALFWDGAIVIALTLFNIVLWVIGAFNRFKIINVVRGTHISESR
ncbi:hypothetical protein D3C81_731950 [compost metagenome]